MTKCVVGAGMVVDWEQETGLLMTSGDVRVIRIWDTDREMKVQVLNALISIVFFKLSPSFQFELGAQVAFGLRIIYCFYFFSR